MKILSAKELENLDSKIEDVIYTLQTLRSDVLDIINSYLLMRTHMNPEDDPMVVMLRKCLWTVNNSIDIFECLGNNVEENKSISEWMVLPSLDATALVRDNYGTPNVYPKSGPRVAGIEWVSGSYLEEEN